MLSQMGKSRSQKNLRILSYQIKLAKLKSKETIIVTTAIIVAEAKMI